MPNYEYHCLNCKKRFEIRIAYSEYGEKKVLCPFCQNHRVQRRIGRVRIAHSDDRRMADLSDPSSLEHIEDDPQALGRMMRRMSSEIGEDMGGEFNEVVSRLEAGQSPDEIEKELPDLGLDDMNAGIGSSAALDSLEDV